MKFPELISLVGDEPVFETGLLLVGEVNPAQIRKQLSLWVQSGRILQLRRGLYALAPPYQKVKPHPFLIANRLRLGTYVSLHSALAHHNLIPEAVPVVTSVGHVRPGLIETPLGTFFFRHIKTDLLWGYDDLLIARSQQAFIASAEKALLDLVYLHPGADIEPYLLGLRLQHLEELDLPRLQRFAQLSNSPKLIRTADILVEMAHQEQSAYIDL